MNKLQQLIQQHCPNGVEYKMLGEITKLSAGGDVPKNNFSKIMTMKYCIPVISNGVGNNALYGYTDLVKIDKRCVTISARGTIGFPTLRTESFYPIVRLITAIPNYKISAEFLKYFLDTVDISGSSAGISQLTVPMISKILIPIPPIEVQEEIVRILDNFQELTAELTARRQQYEYYRDTLLDFGTPENPLAR